MPLAFNNKLPSALSETRVALWDDLQVKLQQWDNTETLPVATRKIGQLHTMRDYVRLLDKIEKLMKEADDVYRK